MVFYSEGLVIKQNPFEGLLCTSCKRQFKEFWCGIKFIYRQFNFMIACGLPCTKRGLKHLPTLKFERLKPT